jgi:hypothetical protein
MSCALRCFEVLEMLWFDDVWREEERIKSEKMGDFIDF